MGAAVNQVPEKSSSPRRANGYFFRTILAFLEQERLTLPVRARVSSATQMVMDRPPFIVRWMPSLPAPRSAVPGSAQSTILASPGAAAEAPRPSQPRADDGPARVATEPPPLSAAPVELATPSPEAAVRAALLAYEAAYARRDIGALTRVFPGLSAAQSQALARTFADAERYGLDLRILTVTISGASATATADVTHALVPKVGNASRNTVRSTFHLTPSGTAWLIGRVDSARR